MRKRSLLILPLIMAVLSLIVIETGYAQSMSKPSVPEFTLRYVNYSYEVPSTTISTTDPYTGTTTTTTNPSYRIINKTIELTIKNQPINPYEINGEKTKLFFNVRFKGHYTTDWITLYPDPDIGYPTQDSTSEYTKLTYGSNSDFRTYIWSDIGSREGKIDFQVQAMLGNAFVDLIQFGDPWIFRGETSDWSSTQTIAIGKEDNSSTTSAPTIPPSQSTPTPNPPESMPSQNPTSIPIQPTTQTDVAFGFHWEQITIAGLVVLVVVLVVALVFSRREKADIK